MAVPEAPARRSPKRFVLPAVKIAVAVALLVALFAFDEDLQLSELSAAKDHAQFLVFGLLSFLCAFSLTVVRWHLVLQSLEVPARFGDVVRLGWIGLLFSQIFPGSTGGDLVKGFYIARESPDQRAEAVLSVVLDRVLGLTALMLVGGLALAFNHQEVFANENLRRVAILLTIFGVAVILGGGLVAWEGFWRQSWLRGITERLPGRRLLGRLARALWTVKGKRKLLVACLLLSLIIHTFNITTVVLLAAALLGELPPLGAYFFLVPIILLATALPLTPGGVGVGEWVSQVLFQFVPGQPDGGLIMILVRLNVIAASLPGIYFYARGKKDLEEAVRAAEEDAMALSIGGQRMLAEAVDTKEAVDAPRGDAGDNDGEEEHNEEIPVRG